MTDEQFKTITDAITAFEAAGDAERADAAQRVAELVGRHCGGAAFFRGKTYITNPSLTDPLRVVGRVYELSRRLYGLA